MEATALAVADLDSFPLEPATSVQKFVVSVSSISNDTSRHLNLAHGALQPIDFNGSVGTCNITFNVVPIRGCKYDFEDVTMVTSGCHGILLVSNLLL